MRLIANEKQINTRTRIGEIAPLAGLGFLIGGMAILWLRSAAVTLAGVTWDRWRIIRKCPKL
jgi:hypothetical protein